MNLVKIWKKYSISIILFCCFLITWIGQGICQWQTLQMEQNYYTSQLTSGYFFAHFWFVTFSNWQSIFLQLFIFVTIISFLIHKENVEIQNSESQINQKLDKIDDTVSKIAKIAGVE
jgi:hypothetical protein